MALGLSDGVLRYGLRGSAALLVLPVEEMAVRRVAPRPADRRGSPKIF
jgi:hypothetical protein